MIQTLAAISSGAEVTSTGGAASKTDASPFMALFAQALTEQGAVAGKAARPLITVLQGDGAQAKAPTGAVFNAEGLLGTVPAQTAFGATVDVTPSAGALLKALLKGGGLAGTPVAPAHGDHVATGAPPPGEAPMATVHAEVGEDDEKALSEDAALLALQPLPVLPLGAALAAVLSGVNTTQVSNDSGEAISLEVDDESSSAEGEAGKNLPGSLAAFAGRQSVSQAQAQAQASGDDVVAAEDGEIAAPLSGAKDSAGPVSGTMASSPSDKLLPSSPLSVSQAPSPVPPAGQEGALTPVRYTGGAVVAEKLVIPMQSGFASPAWQQELGDRLVWLAGRQGQTADLVLNPPSLGAVEVRINMNGGEASAQFFSANPNVRDVLEAALPKLRDMMSGAGIALGEAMVSNQSFSQRQTAQQDKATQPDDGAIASADSGPASYPIRAMGTSLLDYFA